MTNWSSTSRSFPFRSWMISCRSSMFLPVTRTWSSCICPWTLSLVSLMTAQISFPFSLEIPCLMVMILADHPAGGGLRLAVVEGLEGNPSFYALGLEDVDDRLEPEIVVGQDLDGVFLQGHLALRTLEVVALGDLLDASG